MANEAEIIASNILSSAIEYKRLYDQTKNNEYKVKEQRLRRIAENVKLLLSSTSTSSVNSFNGRTGAVVLTSADVTTALGYTPPTNLNGLTDVTLSAPANGQVLTYNSTTSQWENQTPAGGGGGGDMLKSTYDVDNDGTVDSAERIEIIVRNSTGSTLTKGQVVYLSGATGNRPNALLSQAHTEATSSKTIGIVVADITNNSDGYVAVNGTLHDLDTSAFTAGDAVWLSATTAGAYTSTIPAEPNHTVFIGYVARSHPTQGRLVILIQNGYELNELHGVLISSEANNDLLVYESSSTLWKNKSISTIFGGTPLVSVPTLDQVTTAGNTTTNAITVGNATVNGPVNSVFAHTPTTNYTGFGGVQLNVADGTERGFFKLNPGTGEVKIGAVGSGYFTTLHTAGVERMRIFFSSGNVAINTTTDAGYKLDVNGTARVQATVGINTYIAQIINPTNSGAQFGLNVVGGNNDNARILHVANGTQTILNIKGNRSVNLNAPLANGNYATLFVGNAFGGYPTLLVKGNGTASEITFQTQNSSGTALLTTLDNGNVLIGTTTDAGYKLDVNGQFRATGETVLASASGNVGIGTVSPTSKLHINGADPFLRVNNVGSTNTHGIKISYNSSDTQGFHLLYNPPAAAAYLDNTYLVTSGQPYGDIYFRQNVSGTMTTRMTIKADGGNVGIGTTTPTDKLQVAGNVRFGTGAVGTLFFWDNVNGRLGIGNTTPSYKLEVNGGAFFNENIIIANGDGIKFWVDKVRIAPATIDSLGFYTGTTAGSPLEQMRIVSNGNVLIGTTTDNGNKLNVNGDVSAQAYKVNNVLGFTGIFNVPTNPPGQQNIDIQGGIVINVF